MLPEYVQFYQKPGKRIRCIIIENIQQLLEEQSSFLVVAKNIFAQDLTGPPPKNEELRGLLCQSARFKKGTRQATQIIAKRPAVQHGSFAWLCFLASRHARAFANHAGAPMGCPRCGGHYGGD